MGGQFRWIALFRDGHVIEQGSSDTPIDERQAALGRLFDYMQGTEHNPKKHYLLWFKLTNNEIEFIVTFDRDGDAYLTVPGGGMLMTEFKIRSAELIYMREHDKVLDTIAYTIGFGGINTCDKMDGRRVIVASDGSWTLARDLQPSCAMISV